MNHYIIGYTVTTVYIDYSTNTKCKINRTEYK